MRTCCRLPFKFLDMLFDDLIALQQVHLVIHPLEYLTGNILHPDQYGGGNSLVWKFLIKRPGPETIGQVVVLQ